MDIADFEIDTSQFIASTTQNIWGEDQKITVRFPHNYKYKNNLDKIGLGEKLKRLLSKKTRQELYKKEEENSKKQQEILEKAISVIKQKIDFVNEQEENIKKYLIDDDMIDLAEEWVSSLNKAEDEEQECYISSFGEKIFLPITEKNLLESLYFTLMNIEVSENSDNAYVTLLLGCSPDYFCDHSIELDILENGEMKCNGLYG